MKTITVVPDDKMIIVDGTPVRFEAGITLPRKHKALHALQYDAEAGTGHIEYSDGTVNLDLTEADYEKHIQPYVTQYETEQAQQTAEWEALYNSKKQREGRIRTERDRRLKATDYMATMDYPLDDATREKVTAYRQALRDITSADGFPWDGDVDKVPWPVKTW